MFMLIGKASELTEAAGQRLLALDPLLPLQAAPGTGCGTEFVATGADGKLTGIAGCDHWTDKPGSISLTWGAARRFTLRPRIAGPDIPGALDQLLTEWRDHLQEEPTAAEDDTAAMVNWPSRDVEGVRTLQRHGLIPLAVLAARTPRRTAAQEPLPDGVTIRRATPDDLEVVTDFGFELVKYDAYFGEVTERPETRDGLREGSASLLAGPEPWVWLAERDGRAIGLVAVEKPEAAAWVAPYTRLTPAAYLQQGFVLATARAGGIGARLTERYHAEADAADIAVSLLHYSQSNPLSVPFWSQLGYRPLWTAWAARPARTLT
jgi:GNAT superfamily N-acetyltransferase